MAFAATIPEVEDDGLSHPESAPQEEADAYGHELPQEDDERLYIPSYLEEAIPMILSSKLRWLVLCRPRRWKPGGASPVINRDISRGTIGSMRKKMGMGPYSQRGLPKTSRLQRGRRQKCLQWAKTCLKQIPQDENGPLLEPRCILQVHRP